MPSTGQYPLSLFTTVRQALQLLEKQDVDPAEFLQAIIDNPRFRKDLVDAYKQDFTATLLAIPDQPKNLCELVKFATGLKLRDLEKEEKTLRRIGYDSDQIAERIAEIDEWNTEFEEAVKFFSDHGNFVKVFTYLDDLTISIVVASLGLSDGTQKSREDVATAHRISAHRCDALRSRAWKLMRTVADHLLDSGTIPTVDQLPIEVLDLPSRIRNMLRRQRVYLVADLTAKSENQLLALSQMGQNSIDEITAKLAEHGLSLKQ